MIETTSDKIIKAVCFVWGVDRETITMDTSLRSTMEPRQVCMFMIYKYLKYTLTEVGIVMKRQSGRPFNYSAVLYSNRVVDSLMNADIDYKTRCMDVVEILKTGVYIKANGEIKDNQYALREIYKRIPGYEKLLGKLLADPNDMYLDDIKEIQGKVADLNQSLMDKIPS